MYEHFLVDGFGDKNSRILNKPDEDKKSPIIVLTHEFFDALPACIFQY